MNLRLSKFQKQDRRRILELSYKHNLSHIGSCLTAVDGIAAIYSIKKDNESFILGEGHAGLALYVVLERFKKVKAEKLLMKHGIHPNRDVDNGIVCSTGSLGQGLPIALGLALSDKKRNVYYLSSDGELAEGSMWESIRIAASQKLSNIKLVVNANGYGAYDAVNTKHLIPRFKAFGWRVVSINGHNETALATALLKGKNSIFSKCDSLLPTAIIAKTKVTQLPFLNGVDAHYKIMSEEDYHIAMETLNE